MMAPALLPLVLVAVVPQFAEDRSPDPAIQVWLDSDARYERGDFARVFARTAQDGYLVVLHADTEGRVRVLFPLDPWLDDFVRGGEGIELRTRGDREAFLVEERDGSGIVLAAWSADPFRFDPYVRGDHWDYRALETGGVRSDPEVALLDVMHTMAAGRRYEYDVAPYLVGAVEDEYYYADRSPVYRVERWTPHIDWRVGFGTHAGFYLNISVGNSHWYDPWYYDPWYYKHSWWSHGPRYGVPYPVWYRPVYYDPFYYGPIHRPRYVILDPYNWRHPRWRPGPGIGVHVRYGAGDCWNRWRCGSPFPPRPGRATGIAYGDDGGAWPWGRYDDRDPRPGGIGRGTAQPRGNSTAVRVSDPQVDLGRGRAAVRAIGDRATEPGVTSTTETRRPDQRIPVWPGDAGRGNGTATIRTEPTRTRNASDVVRRAETATSTESTADPRRSNGNGIGRRAIERSDTETRDNDRSSMRARVIAPPAATSTNERASSTGQSRESRSVGERARSTEGQSIGRRPIDRSTTSAPSREETARRSVPDNRSNAVGRRSIGSAVEPPTRNEARSRSTQSNTRIIRSGPPETRSDPNRSVAERARSTAGRDLGNSASARRAPVGTASRNSSRASGGSDARASTSIGRARSSSGGGSARSSGSSSVGSGSSRSSGGSAARASSGSGSSRAGSGSARSSGGIGSRARRGGN
jgi:hypothetical protein